LAGQACRLRGERDRRRGDDLRAAQVDACGDRLGLGAFDDGQGVSADRGEHGRGDDQSAQQYRRFTPDPGKSSPAPGKFVPTHAKHHKGNSRDIPNRYQIHGSGNDRRNPHCYAPTNTEIAEFTEQIYEFIRDCGVTELSPKRYLMRGSGTRSPTSPSTRSDRVVDLGGEHAQQSAETVPDSHLGLVS
jgi:hypothetical protein